MIEGERDERVAVLDYAGPDDFLKNALARKVGIIVCGEKVFGKIAADVDYFSRFFASEPKHSWLVPDESQEGGLVFSDEAKLRIAQGEKLIVCLSDDGSDLEEHRRIMAHLDQMRAKVVYLVKVR
ncbi:MAG: hypothetical protein WC449_02450 [Candidatus Paceibacterota bacterium]